MDILPPSSLIAAHRRRRLKERAKLVIAGLLCLIVAAIPGTLLYLLWHWCIAQVSATIAYAGVIKVAITLALALFGGGATITLTFLFAATALAIATVILD